jgi:ribosomal protein S6--L-glutamate ligase
VYRVNGHADLATLDMAERSPCYFLAQRYAENAGFDIKLYVIGKDVYAVAKKSPLHPEVEVEEQLIPLTSEWRGLALRAGKVFGLDIYGLDVLATSNGPIVVDINDFPSFGQVPGAVSHVSNYILHIAEQARLKRRRNNAMVIQARMPISKGRCELPFEVEENVKVTVDRRRCERRTTRRPVAIERRQADRRSSREHLVEAIVTAEGES